MDPTPSPTKRNDTDPGPVRSGRSKARANDVYTRVRRAIGPYLRNVLRIDRRPNCRRSRFYYIIIRRSANRYVTTYAARTDQRRPRTTYRDVRVPCRFSGYGKYFRRSGDKIVPSCYGKKVRAKTLAPKSTRYYKNGWRRPGNSARRILSIRIFAFSMTNREFSFSIYLFLPPPHTHTARYERTNNSSENCSPLAKRRRYTNAPRVFREHDRFSRFRIINTGAPCFRIRKSYFVVLPFSANVIGNVSIKPGER